MIYANFTTGGPPIVWRLVRGQLHALSLRRSKHSASWPQVRITGVGPVASGFFELLDSTAGLSPVRLGPLASGMFEFLDIHHSTLPRSAIPRLRTPRLPRPNLSHSLHSGTILGHVFGWKAVVASLAKRRRGYRQNVRELGFSIQVNAVLYAHLVYRKLFFALDLRR